MKLLREFEPCLVLIERERVTAVRWRGRTRTVTKLLEVWVYRGAWWLEPSLEGERRVYHVLATKLGEIEVFEQTLNGTVAWLVSRWFD